MISVSIGPGASTFTVIGKNRAYIRDILSDILG